MRLRLDQARNRNKLGLLLLIALFGVGHLVSLSFEPDQDVASERQKKTGRATKLGKAVREQRKAVEEDVRINDPAIAAKWGLLSTQSKDAWRLSLGSRDIVVAVIDTGVDTDHPDLKNNLWVNPGESGKDSLGRNCATNGLDDDGNGLIDDVHGWNFAANNKDISDSHGHGTHIAGIIGAEGGNNLGISGISPKVSLMILKYYDPKAPGVNNLYNTVKAINYAVEKGARIINYSGGGLEISPEERAAIEVAGRKGILFVAAAGNERSDSDKKGYYPADYDLNNIISVTAIEKDTHQVLPTSNYGRNTVDLAAPGKNIYSTLPGGFFGQMTGTSQATAFVSGVAALIMAKYRDFPPEKVISHIMQTGDYMESTLADKTKTGKRMNTYRALAILSEGVSANGTIALNVREGTKFNTEEPNPEALRSLGSLQRPGSSLDELAFFTKSMENLIKNTQSPRQKSRLNQPAL